MPKILIIEDEETLREMYFEKFSREGFEVLTSDNSVDGLNLVKIENPDLIILDILLPREDGIGFLKRLRHDKLMSDKKVIAFSNYQNEETKKQARELGVKAYLLKTDYTPQEMVKKIKKYL